MSNLFKPNERGPAPKPVDAPAGRPTARTTKLGHALRLLKIEDEFTAGRRDSYANQLDRTVASLGLKGDGIKNLRAYSDAVSFYQTHTGKRWEQ